MLQLVHGTRVRRNGATGIDGGIVTEAVVSTVKLLIHEIRSQVVDGDAGNLEVIEAWYRLSERLLGDDNYR